MKTAAEKTILIVDDDARNREYLDTLLKSEGYATLQADSGETALDIAGRQLPDLILLDAMMPGMDGFDVADRLKSMEATKSVPIIMITALIDRDSRLRALHCGVEEFLTKPVDRSELWIRVRNLLRLKEYSDFLANYSHTLEEQVRERSNQLVESYFDTIFTITRAAEFRDEETGAHIRRISFYTRELASHLGMGKEFVDTIYHASPLHDVGKIGVPDQILLKPGKHDPDEWKIMKSHTSLGASILGMGKSTSTSPYTKMGAEIALNHHEKWNGKGYPNGLMKEEIPLPARIMAICDVYDALRSRRPYKPAFPHEETVAIIMEGDGRTLPEDFDPQVLDAFGRCTGIFNDIFASHAD
ncbi:MAG: response regulator [Burkholderiales bacterium]|nr:response regulator [Burkholderiales bacterium]